MNRAASSPEQVLRALRSELEQNLPLDVQTRLAARLETAVAAIDLDLGVAARDSQVASPSRSTSSAERPVSATDRLAAQLASHPVASMVAAVALGGVMGAASHAAWTSRKSDAQANTTLPAAHPRAPTPVPLQGQERAVSVEDLPIVAAPVPSASDKMSASRRAKLAQPVPGGSVSPMPEASVSLAAQLALLERARAALGRGDADTALQTLASHARQYPGGMLSEEREALIIKALGRAGRLPEARAHLARFEAQFPGSLMLSALRGTVGDNP